MKIQFYPVGCISDEELDDNIRHARALGLPLASGAGRLALVGGGPSALEHVDELRKWDGPIWAINGAAAWCHAQGIIGAALVTLHPFVEVPWFMREVILGEECSPLLFRKCRGKKLSLLHCHTATGQVVPRGCTTATAVAFMVPLLGFADVTFFGLEGSYGEQSHNYEVYQDPDEWWVVVRANGQLFRTKSEFLLQSQYLAELVHWNPIYEERSGGLLRALVADHEYDVIDAAPGLLTCIEAEIRAQTGRDL